MLRGAVVSTGTLDFFVTNDKCCIEASNVIVT